MSVRSVKTHAGIPQTTSAMSSQGTKRKRGNGLRPEPQPSSKKIALADTSNKPLPKTKKNPLPDPGVKTPMDSDADDENTDGEMTDAEMTAIDEICANYNRALANHKKRLQEQELLINLANNQITDLKKHNTALTREVHRVAAERDELENELDNTEDTCDDLRAELKETQEELEDAKDELLSVTAKADCLEEDSKYEEELHDAVIEDLQTLQRNVEKTMRLRNRPAPATPVILASKALKEINADLKLVVTGNWCAPTLQPKVYGVSRP